MVVVLDVFFLGRMAIKSYKYRLYPTAKQVLRLEETLTTCRYLYNHALGDRRDTYKTTQKGVSYVDQANALSKNKNDYQKQVHSQVLQDTLKRIDKSFQNFFRRCAEKKAGKKIKVGFPRFKPARRYNSFCYPQSGFKLSNDNSRISLSKIGDIKLIYSRPVEGQIKTCRILRDVDQWFVIITGETEDKPFVPNGKPVVGIDVGIKTLAAISDGTHIDNPRILRKSEKKLHREQRRLSRKVKWSRNRNKQRIQVAIVHRKIRRQRTDHLHKLSTMLVNSYGHIVFEDLRIRNMVKNHKLAKHISDVSWGTLIEMTINKAASAGCIVEKVDPRNTSQNCSGCGKRVEKGLSERVHSCPHCGLVMDRDDNASLNIMHRSRVGTTQTVNTMLTNAYRSDIMYHGSCSISGLGSLSSRDVTATLKNADLMQVMLEK